ncbi:O-antigen ligase family protein [Paraglaciecola aquimarina]|uniref:O-antigen ligase family protein n=1 Tax=Paraglaciecola algarum TaxID=3050085 RepID=A0ABS9DAG1_9ALTE|nr:O-antigen ligase family protein [Paraglaciecola sp. G1-23]MCF2949904.1 O-antigen ligase family protein [Paraglaciecola sp. G1-23]
MTLTKQDLSPQKSHYTLFLFFFFYLLFILPLPLGSNRPSAWSIGQIFVYCLLLFYVGFNWHQAKKTIIQNWFPIGIFVIVIGWMAFQYIAIPLDWLKILSPHSAAAYQKLGLESGSITLDKDETINSLLKLSGYLCVFLLGLCLLNTPKRVQLTLLFMVFAGTFNAFYGVFEILSGQDVSFVYAMKNDLRADGTFVSHNHFANFLTLCLSAGVGYFITTLTQRTFSSKKAYWQSWVYSLLETKTVVRLCLVIMVIALVMSHSRMGNTAFFSSFLGVSLLYMFIGKQVPKGLKVLVISMLIIDTFIVSAWFGLEKLTTRLTSTSLEAESRDEVVLDALPIVMDYPFTGSGAGSFQTIFASYKSERVGGFYDHAHNDYLQFTIEYGIPITLLLGILMLYMITLSIKLIYAASDKLVVGGAAAALMATSGMLIHMSVSFPLLPPANASYFVLFLAIICSLRTCFKNS